jgi:D,D-heptose 1,7-bisphosphate phosphatase
MKNKAVFIDRDGVINEIIYHKEMGILDSPFNADQIKLLPDVGKAISELKKMGYKTIIVSNQPGIAKNRFSEEEFSKMKEKVRDELKKQGAVVDDEYYCIHHPYGKIEEYTKKCNCRKPEPGMILKAAEKHNIDLSNSWMIGDGITDIQAGKKAGCKTIMIGRMKCDLCQKMAEENAEPDHITPTLYEASKIIQNGKSD